MISPFVGLTNLLKNKVLNTTQWDQFLIFGFSQERQFLLLSHEENSTKLSDYQRSDRVDFHSAAHPCASDCVFWDVVQRLLSSGGQEEGLTHCTGDRERREGAETSTAPQ